jgi:transposase
VSRAAEQGRPDVADPRRAWRGGQPAMPEGLVLVDETWASTNMARRQGRSPRGQRLVCPVPHGRWKTTTFVAALRREGLTAPLVIDGAVNGDPFVAYVERVLVPALRQGGVVVMDNLSSHKRSEVRAPVEAACCTLLYLPPYSPDLNPIELAFSKLKRMLRSAAERAVEGLWAFLGRLLDAFPPQRVRRLHQALRLQRYEPMSSRLSTIREADRRGEEEAGLVPEQQVGLAHERLAEDARVLVAQPPGHLHVVALPGLPPGLLAGPAEPAFEDLADALGVVGDAGAALDEPGDAGGGPQLVVPAVALDALQQEGF